MKDDTYIPEEEQATRPVNKSVKGQADSEIKIERSDSAGEDVPLIRTLTQARAVMQALLFATTEPLTVARLEKLTGLSRSTVRGLALQLQMEYAADPGGLQVIEVAGGFQMATRPEVHPWLAELIITRGKGSERLTVASLETLAIIAYKQPVTRAGINTIRGVQSSGTMKKLMDFDLIKVVGHQPPPNRSYLYGTTKEFLRMFGLKSIKELPTLDELKVKMGLKKQAG